MNRHGSEDTGRLVLRLAIGGLMLFHGVSKLSHGVARIGDNLARHGLPRFVSLGVYVGEVIAPLLLIAGIGTRPAAAIVAFNMVVAIALSHPADVFKLGTGGAWAVELPMLYMLGAIAIALLGAGKFSVSRGKGRWD